MAYRIVRNTRQSVTLLFTSTTAALTIAGNSSVSNVGLSGLDDNIVGVAIKQVWSSADSGAGANGWDIARGANTVWSTDSTSWLDFAGNGQAITLDFDATLAATRTGSRGTLMVELQKIYDSGFATENSSY